MKENRCFSRENIRFVTTLNLIKCNIYLITEVAPYVRTFSELPSNIRTMGDTNINTSKDKTNFSLSVNVKENKNK